MFQDLAANVIEYKIVINWRFSESVICAPVATMKGKFLELIGVDVF